MQRKAFFIGFWNDYAEQFYDIDEIQGYQVEVINLRKKAYGGNIILRWSKRAKRFCWRRLIRRLMNRYPTSSFFFQGKEKLTRLLVGMPITVHAAVICSNVIEAEGLAGDIRILQGKGFAIWSFDQSECKARSFRYYDQFARKFPLDNALEPSIDLLFVGRDKGRRRKVEELAEELSAVGLKVCLEFAGDGVNLLAYQDYLSLLADTKCLLEITKDGQIGPTLRSVEAAIYNKKLITDIVSIKDTALYAPDRVFILKNETTTGELVRFLNAPHRAVDSESLYPYSPGCFMTRLLGERYNCPAQPGLRYEARQNGEPRSPIVGPPGSA